jgi:hypothetical protein
MADQMCREHPLEDPEGHLEQSLIDEYFRGRGYDLRAVLALPAAERVVCCARRHSPLISS